MSKDDHFPTVGFVWQAFLFSVGFLLTHPVCFPTGVEPVHRDGEKGLLPADPGLGDPHPHTVEDPEGGRRPHGGPQEAHVCVGYGRQSPRLKIFVSLWTVRKLLRQSERTLSLDSTCNSVI